MWRCPEFHEFPWCVVERRGGERKREREMHKIWYANETLEQMSRKVPEYKLSNVRIILEKGPFRHDMASIAIWFHVGQSELTAMQIRQTSVAYNSEGGRRKTYAMSMSKYFGGSST